MPGATTKQHGKKGKLRTIADVMARLLWDTTCYDQAIANPAADYFIGYDDRIAIGRKATRSRINFAKANNSER